MRNILEISKKNNGKIIKRKHNFWTGIASHLYRNQKGAPGIGAPFRFSVQLRGYTENVRKLRFRFRIFTEKCIIIV